MRRSSCVFLCLIAPALAGAASLRVPAEHATIQAAVDAAADGDTIRIAPGDYIENVKIEEKGALVLIGEEGAEKTFLDGNGEGIVLEVLRSGRTVVRGLTFQRGNTYANGGGLLAQQSEIEVWECRFLGNIASNEGGGLMFGNCSDFLVADCVIEKNESEASAAISVVGGRGVLERNLIRNNTGGLTLSATFTGCVIRENTIIDNLSTRLGVIGYGSSYGGEIRENTIARNLGKEGTGAVLAQGGMLRIERNVIAFNEGVHGMQVESLDKLVTLSGNLIHGNEGGGYLGSVTGEEDLDEDPLFCDAGKGDYRVREGSPCLDGNGNRVIGAKGMGCD